MFPSTIATFRLSVALFSSGSWAPRLWLWAGICLPGLPASCAIALVHRGDELAVTHGARVNQLFRVVLVFTVLELQVVRRRPEFMRICAT